jgi:hypothetical protein
MLTKVVVQLVISMYMYYKRKEQDEKKEGINGKGVEGEKTFTSPCRKETIDTVE